MKSNVGILIIMLFSILMLGHQFAVAQSNENISAELKEEVQQLIDDGVTSINSRGLVVTIELDGDRWTSSTGVKDSQNTPIDINKRFLFRSYTKTQTSIVILKLQEEGLLNLNSTLEDYIEPVNNVDSSITLKSLLDMTASTCNFLDNDEFWNFFNSYPDSVVNTTDVLNRFIPSGDCNRGNEYYYNDTNFELLGLVIEAVTESSGETVFDNKIYSPLGLTSAELAPVDAPEESFNGVWWNVGDDILDFSSVSKNLLFTIQRYDAGSVMNTSDALTLLKALLEGELLNEESLAKMMTPSEASVPDRGLFLGYGYGLMKFKNVAGGIFYGHSGSGANATLTTYNPDQKIGIVLAGNYRSDYQAILPIFDDIYEAINSCAEQGACNVVSNEDNDFSSPNTFEVQQNYPNPFNPSTNISFSIPEASDVSLKIYNLLGQEVASLVDGKVAAGNHSFTFNAGNLSSGLYIYRVYAGDQVISRKMSLVK